MTQRIEIYASEAQRQTHYAHVDQLFGELVKTDGDALFCRLCERWWHKDAWRPPAVTSEENQALYKHNVAKSVDTWRERGELPPAMGQPTNAEIMEKLDTVLRELTTPDLWMQDKQEAILTALGRIERDQETIKFRLTNNSDATQRVQNELRMIDTRLATLEAAFGIASSKGAEKFEQILHAVDALHIARGETLTDIVWGTRPWTATLKKGKKKHRRKA